MFFLKTALPDRIPLFYPLFPLKTRTLASIVARLFPLFPPWNLTPARIMAGIRPFLPLRNLLLANAAAGFYSHGMAKLGKPPPPRPLPAGLRLLQRAPQLSLVLFPPPLLLGWRPCLIVSGAL